MAVELSLRVFLRMSINNSDLLYAAFSPYYNISLKLTKIAKIIYDLDYTDVKKHRSSWEIISGRLYIPPAGSIFYGLSNSEIKSNWPIAYHGTSPKAALKII